MSRPPRRAQQTRSLVLALAVVASMLAAVGAESAAADDGGEPIRLEYRAGPGCPNEEAFVARIRARTARARLVGEGEGEKVRTFAVELAAGEHPSGSVTVTDGLRSGGTRRLDADTCDDVADALALMVALALDPHAGSAPAPPQAPPAPPPALDAGVEPALDAALTPDSSPPPPPPPPAPAPVPEPPTTPSDAATPGGPLRRDLNFFAGVDFVVATGVTPSTLLTGAPYVGWRTTRASLFGGNLLGVSVRTAFLRVGTGTVGVTDGSAAFTWTVGRLDGCAMLWPDRALRVGACARAEVGILDATGEGALASSQTQHSPWGAVGTLARLEWSVLGPLMLDAEVGPDFHISADHFYFSPPAPSDSGYTVPVVGLDAEAGVGVHFL